MQRLQHGCHELINSPLACELWPHLALFRCYGSMWGQSSEMSRESIGVHVRTATIKFCKLLYPHTQPCIVACEYCLQCSFCKTETARSTRWVGTQTCDHHRHDYSTIHHPHIILQLSIHPHTYICWAYTYSPTRAVVRTYVRVLLPLRTHYVYRLYIWSI